MVLREDGKPKYSWRGWRVICPRCGREGWRQLYRMRKNGRVYEYVRVEHGKWFDPVRGKWVHDICHIGPLHPYGMPPGGTGRGYGVPLPVKLLMVTNLESIDYSAVIDRALQLALKALEISKREPLMLKRWREQLERVAASAPSWGEVAEEAANEALLHAIEAERQRWRRLTTEPLPIRLPRDGEGREMTEDELLLARLIGLPPLGEVVDRLVRAQEEGKEKEEGGEKGFTGARARAQRASAR